ncbi:MAG TPA: amidohydrolase family protein [Cyclobacteriaceae bacterium]
MFRLLCIASILISTYSFAQTDSSRIVFQNANIIDGVSNETLTGYTVFVEQGKIKSIGKKLKSIPSNALVIDLSGQWLLPGYIDAHTHFTSYKAAQTAVKAGVTSARTMNCSYFIDVEIRDAHRKGRMDLPEIVAAGYQIRPDLPDDFFKDFPELIDLKPRMSGVENVRRAVQANISKGVNHIKILATERGGTPDTDPRKRTFTDEELKVIVEEATKAGIPVAAHAHGDEGAAAAVQAGVRSIEHGTYMSLPTLQLMKQKGTFYTSTRALAYVYDTLKFTKNNPKMLQTLMDVRKYQKEVIMHAFGLGIPVVGGTDSDYTMVPAFNVTLEAVQLAESGLSFMDAIKAITSVPARLLKIDDHTGSIKPGYDADLVVLAADPLKAITQLQKPQLVVNDGKIVVNKMKRGILKK